MSQITQNETTRDKEIAEKIKNTLQSTHVENTVSEVIVKDAGVKAGHGSIAKYATVKFKDQNIKPLNLFVKARTTNASHSEMLNEIKAFEKESRLFTQYVPAAEEMCKQKGFEGFIDFYSKCYYGDENMIVLENLVLDKGYKLIDKNIRQDFEAAKFAIETLAKHHAISHVMIQETGGARKFFEKFPLLDWEAYDKPMIMNMMTSALENAIDANVKLLEKSGVDGATQVAEKLKSLKGKPMGILIDTLNSKGDDTMKVMGHGDYWNNNMMFLWDNETKKIIHHKALDFQVTRHNSVAVDLGQFLFTSVQPDVRQKYFNELLKIYMDKLNSVTEQFGHPLNISYEQLLMEFRRKFKYGFWIGFTFNVGPGMALFENVDVNNVDIEDYAAISEISINKWIEKNPGKCPEIAKELILMFKQYDDLEIPTN